MFRSLWAAQCLRLLLALPVLACGCLEQRPAPLEPVQSQPRVEQFNIQPYLRASRLGRWTYMRVDPQKDSAQAVTYPRISSVQRMTEGKLANRDFLPIRDYLLQPGQSKPGSDRPQPPLGKGSAFMFELAEPMEPIPSQLTPEAPISSSTAVRYYGRNGRLISPGTLTRTAEIAGYDRVETPAGSFADCLRVRVDFKLEIPWMLTLDWNSYLWLSAQAGEVKRSQRMSGWFLIFHFSSAHEYQLSSGWSYPASTAPDSMRPPLWHRGAVIMDSTIPSPQIGGMMVEYADPAELAIAEEQPADQNGPSEPLPSETRPAEDS